jgi:hypothetical protein
MIGDAIREAGEGQHVVRDHRPRGAPVVGLHAVVHVGQPCLGDLHDVLGEPGQQDLDLRRAGRDPAAHPQRRRQPQERAQVVALPGGIGERQPYHARHGGHREAENQRLQQGTRPARAPALGDQKMAVPGEPHHRGQGRQVFRVAHLGADAQSIRRRRVPGRPVGTPVPVAETAQGPRMPGGQRRHGAEEITGGPGQDLLRPPSAGPDIRRAPGREAVQVMLMVVSDDRGRLRQAHIAVPGLPRGRLYRHAAPLRLWPVPGQRPAGRSGASPGSTRAVSSSALTIGIPRGTIRSFLSNFPFSDRPSMVTSRQQRASFRRTFGPGRDFRPPAMAARVAVPQKSGRSPRRAAGTSSPSGSGSPPAKRRTGSPSDLLLLHRLLPHRRGRGAAESGSCCGTLFVIPVTLGSGQQFVTCAGSRPRHDRCHGGEHERSRVAWRSPVPGRGRVARMAGLT